MNEYDSQISINSGFCNDRDTSSTWTSTGRNIYYGAYIRRNGTPTFKCNNINDLYQTKIGLITADEVMYAGGKSDTSNYGYYLYTGDYYWTISPYGHTNLSACLVYQVRNAGELSAGGSDNIHFSYGVRPVINLKADVTISSGNGTASNPFVIALTNWQFWENLGVT